MPNRIIKESLLVSADYARLTLFERDLFIRLIVAADDYGRYDARPAIIRGRLMPLEEVTAEVIGQGLRALEAKGLIQLYEHEGCAYLRLTGWERHQNIRAKKSRYPAPESACAQMHADAPVIQSVSESISESESVSEPREAPRPPTAEEVRAYCRSQALSVDADRFVDYYRARAWQVAGKPVKDWRRLCHSWQQPSRSTGPPPRKLSFANYTQREHHESIEEDLARIMNL